MHIILSRKGFDSKNGGQPSPILPNGTLLSLPIPEEEKVITDDTYGSLSYDGNSFYDIIKELRPSAKRGKDEKCHLDPDIRENVKQRDSGWTPAYGQIDGSLTHLQNNNVGVNDIFLFFGWFRKTEIINGKLKYKRKAPDIHVIFGYLQVGTIINSKKDIPVGIKDHPHAQDFYDKYWEKDNNALFLPKNKLSILPNMKGSGVLSYRDDRVLTKDGYSRGRWKLPDCFKEAKITHHKNPWKGDYFQSNPIGQEFVMEANQGIIEWVKSIIKD